MTHQTDGKEEHVAALPPILGYLQRAWEPQWTLRLIYLALFADIALLATGRHGLLHWSIDGESWLRNVVFVVLCASAFGLCASFLLPFSARVLRDLAGLAASVIPSRWMSGFDAEPRWHRPIGRVTPYELRPLALEEQSDFLLRLCDEHEHRRREASALREQFGNLLFGVLVLTVFDGAGVVGGSTDVSIIQASIHAVEPWIGISVFWSLILVSVSGLIILRAMWRDNYAPGWIEYPRLYRVLSAKEDAERRERHEMHMQAYRRAQHTVDYSSDD